MVNLINKIKGTFFRHKVRIDKLEEQVSILENRIKLLEQEVNNPWKMPFD